MRLLPLLLITAALLTGLPTPGYAGEGEVNSAIIQVDGLSCPFCAYGLEKKLKQVRGVTQVDVALKTGEVTVTMQPDVTVTDAALEKAVRDAGFTPRAITRSEANRS